MRADIVRAGGVVGLESPTTLIPFVVIGFMVSGVAWLGNRPTGIHPILAIASGCVWGTLGAVVMSAFGIEGGGRLVGVIGLALFGQKLIVEKLGKYIDRISPNRFGEWLVGVLRAAVRAMFGGKV